jgi:hypothetical protein
MTQIFKFTISSPSTFPYFWVTVFACGLTLFAAACRNELPPGSDFLHTPGGGNVVYRKLDSCKEAAMKIDETAKLPLAKRYLENLANNLAKGTSLNGLNIFKNEMAIENFCFSVEFNQQNYAYSNPGNGHIVYTTNLLLTQTDDSLFSTMAHELAHVLLNHGQSHPASAFPIAFQSIDGSKIKELNQRGSEIAKATETAGNQSIILANLGTKDEVDRLIATHMGVKDLSDQEPKDVIAAFSKLVLARNSCGQKCEEFKRIIAEFNKKIEEFEAIEIAVNNIIAKYYSKEQLANQKEVDADNLGLEILAFGGFSEIAIQVLFVTARARWLETTAGAQAKTDPALSCLAQRTPKRGERSHPEGCWRFQNVYAEYQEHKKIYASATKLNARHLLLPTLEEVRKEILAAAPPPATERATSTTIQTPETKGQYAPSNTTAAPTP